MPVPYRCKDHEKAGKKTKVITKYKVTDVAVHDSRELKNLVEEGKDERIYADSAYTGKEVQGCIPEGAQNRIHEKEHRDHPLSTRQEREKKKKSHIWVRYVYLRSMKLCDSI
jgi:IS5 family transposase